MLRTLRKLITIATTAALAAGGVVISASAGASPSVSRSRPYLTERHILRIALAAAAGAGDSTPRLIQHSAGTRYQANLIDSGDLVPGRRWSYLIAERGHFVFENASRPQGAPAPRGTVITLMVDAATGETTDTGISNRYPHLRSLGPVRTDLRRASR